MLWLNDNAILCNLDSHLLSRKAPRYISFSYIDTPRTFQRQSFITAQRERIMHNLARGLIYVTT